MDILIKQLIIVRLMADNVDIFVRAGMRYMREEVSVAVLPAGYFLF